MQSHSNVIVTVALAVFGDIFMNIAVLGACWGDEGKGHIVHHFSANYDWVVRFNGGANAGHTIYRDGIKYVHNLMPSFDWRSERPKAFLSSGMVIDLTQLTLEVSNLAKVNKQLPARVYVDPDAFLVLPEHQEEDRQNNAHIGSTNRGIGPAYKAKIGRTGIRIRNVLNGYSDININNCIKELKSYGVNFISLLDLKSEMKYSDILYEGAQGIMLDINHGIYPYVSCSESTVAGIYSAGFHFEPPEKVYGVAKCYTTKVGEGPFPTELLGEEAEKLRKQGKEYGATTGRPRRIGWADLPALKYACEKGGITNLIFTKFDILNGMENVKVCHQYGKMPTCSDDFFHAQPLYKDVPGWVDAHNDAQLIPFIQLVEGVTEHHVSYISRGTDSKDISKW
jgi:adenylosuccinate synthase